MPLIVNTHSGSTVANTALDLSNSSYYASVLITNRSTVASPVELWVRLDGQPATVGGDGCFLVLASTSKSMHNLSQPTEKAISFTGSSAVSIISSTICPYYVEFN